MGLGIMPPSSDYFVPKLEVLDNVPRVSSSSVEMIPPPLTETITRKNNIKTRYIHIQDESRSLASPTSNLNLPSPSEEDPNSPTFFIDSYSKIRTLSGELFKCSGDALTKGIPADNVKIEFYAHEILKVARQLNNSGEDDDKKRLPPPLVRPRRIRRKHNEEEELLVDDGDKRRKITPISTPELYCHSCGTTDTPEWRRGPDGCKSLCNACGLHYAKILRRETMIPNRQPARQTMTLNNLLN